MDNAYCLILTTTDSQSTADQLASHLVKEKLAACVQVMPITSFYTWQGDFNKDAEWLLLVKTKTSRYSDVEKALLTHHPYDTPEIIQIPITQGSQPYLGWIDETMS